MTPPSSSPLIFDRALVRAHFVRARSALPHHRALFDATANELKERVADVARTFGAILDLSPLPIGLSPKAVTNGEILFDEEALPFASKSFDLIISNLGLHWVNDVPGALVQIKDLLKPNGLFLASFFGGETLKEFRSALLEAELKLSNGASPRLSPTIDLLTASQLMQRAGFSLPVADKETIEVRYPSILALMRDLRGMGQSNAMHERVRTMTRRDLFNEAQKIYEDRFGLENGILPASFDVIYLHGWK